MTLLGAILAPDGDFSGDFADDRGHIPGEGEREGAMLLRFTVENLTCFHQEVIFSMVANSDDRHSDHLITKDKGRPQKVLPIAALYGANAHGKTRLIEAVSVLRDVVLWEARKDRKIPGIVPFRLDPEAVKKPTRFSIDFHTEGADYEYGLVLTSKEILEEWLYRFQGKREEKLFVRVTKAGKTEADFGQSIIAEHKPGYCDYVGIGTPPNKTLLSEGAFRNIEALAAPFRWFDKVLWVVKSGRPVAPIPLIANQDSTFLEMIEGFICGVDVGISKIVVMKKEIDALDVSKETKAELRTMLDDVSGGEAGAISFGDEEGEHTNMCMESDGSAVVIKLSSIHRSRNEEEISFDFSEESAGTRRLLELVPIIVDIAQGGRVILVDELDRKLHPLLAERLVREVLSLGRESGKGQLIFTTHNTHLLDLNLLRRDEIWFVEKKTGGASDLYSLLNLKIRPDLQIEKGYLNGRFGAIPFLGNLDDLGWLKKGDTKRRKASKTKPRRGESQDQGEDGHSGEGGEHA